ncbi:MAG: GMC family oxidoreductase [Pseudomonadota bacterium]|nr:GMC family oxidoreductase [Pseudomonadota bacterium]
MIGNADNIVRNAVLCTDICVIGGGAAGIALALQFLRGGQNVLVLESGAETADAVTQALYEGDVVDPDLHSPPDKYRQRRFGGSTTIWGGRCMPFDPIDFEQRSWIADSGWPIGLAELQPYYPAANAICEAGEFEYDAARALPGGMRPMLRDFEPQEFETDRIERFSCPTDLGRRYRHRLAASDDVRILLNANCTRLITSADGARLDRVQVQTVRGNRFAVAANQFVLATGGLEVPRLLLASRDTQARGIGNAEDLVGRYYMCHIAGTMGTFRTDLPRHDIWHGYERAEDGTYCRRRIALTADSQRRHEIGNIVFRLHHPRIPDPRHRTGALSALYLARNLISYEYGKRLTGEGKVGVSDWLRHVANVATDPLGTAGFLTHLLRMRTFSQRKFPSVIIRPRANLFSLDFHAEQLPNRASRVGLADTLDQLGLPRLSVDWRYAEGDIRTVRQGFVLLRQELARWGHGSLTSDAGTNDNATNDDGANDDRACEVEAAIRRDGAYGGHHIGTARMGASPATGVVDANCRVFGVHNLYIAGSAVFPTSSQANPTLTIVALAIRLAAHLKAQAMRPLEMAVAAVITDRRWPEMATRDAGTVAATDAWHTR